MASNELSDECKFFLVARRIVQKMATTTWEGISCVQQEFQDGGFCITEFLGRVKGKRLPG